MASDAPTVIANRPRPGRAWLRADRGTPTRTTEDLIRATIDFHSAEQHASTFNMNAPPQSPRRRIEPPTHMAVVGSRRARLMVWESKRRVAGIENATDDVYLDGVKMLCWVFGSASAKHAFSRPLGGSSSANVAFDPSQNSTIVSLPRQGKRRP